MHELHCLVCYLSATKLSTTAAAAEAAAAAALKFTQTLFSSVY
jgi:hypothetical protein